MPDRHDVITKARLFGLLVVLVALANFSVSLAQGTQAPANKAAADKAAADKAAADKAAADKAAADKAAADKAAADKAAADKAAAEKPMKIVDVFIFTKSDKAAADKAAEDKAAADKKNQGDEAGIKRNQDDEMGIKKNQDVEAGIGDRIRVHVAGLKEAIDSTKLDPHKLVLYLDGLELKGNYAIPINTANGELEFMLERTDKSKDAWDTLLGRPTAYKKTVAVSVGPEGGQGIQPDTNKPVMTLRVLYKGRFVIFTILFLGTLVIFWWRAIKGNIVRDSNPPNPPQEKRKPYSLARIQMAVWFFLVVGSFVFLYLITGDYNTVTEQALILIGIGTGTALGAAAIDANKRTSADTELNTLLPQRSKLDAQINEAKTTKSALEAKISANPPGAPDDVSALGTVKIDLAEKEAQLVELDNKIDVARSGLTKPVSEGFFNDLLTDANGTSFHRFQMVIWTIVLAFLFCVGVYQRLAMPEFSTTLLALMGISAGTYLGFKIPERQ